MFGYVESLLGYAADPAGAVVWSSGELVTLALAGALLLCIFALAALRERGAAGGLGRSSGRKPFGAGGGLPSAA